MELKLWVFFGVFDEKCYKLYLIRIKFIDYKCVIDILIDKDEVKVYVLFLMLVCILFLVIFVFIYLRF